VQNEKRASPRLQGAWKVGIVDVQPMGGVTGRDETVAEYRSNF
jgi:hypothetical protein